MVSFNFRIFNLILKVLNTISSKLIAHTIQPFLQVELLKWILLHNFFPFIDLAIENAVHAKEQFSEALDTGHIGEVASDLTLLPEIIIRQILSL